MFKTYQEQNFHHKYCEQCIQMSSNFDQRVKVYKHRKRESTLDCI